MFTFPDTGQTVRTIMIDGAPWWVARDVLDILGLVNPTEALRGLDEDEFSTAEVIDSTGRRQPHAYIVTEPGLYSLILRSRKPQARAFKRWVTHEVLPQIRRTGAYAAPGAVPALPDLTEPAGVLALAEQFLSTARALVDADARVRELEPKAAAHDAYLSAHDSDRLIREVAKLFGIRETWLRGFLVDEGLIFARYAPCGHRSGTCTPTSARTSGQRKPSSATTSRGRAPTTHCGSPRAASTSSANGSSRPATSP
ncbi:BRO family protein [Streptomyces sp. NBRC 110611]|uniref:BRO family protein n=1 Tax=Streptomyces sp. NBRC 110611 TaxID=1621259 RepID=UPI0015EE6162|nr:BRO family protein [Streptomyces sp. NBRC 110611]